MGRTIIILIISIFLTSSLFCYLIICGFNSEKIISFLDKTKEYKKETDFKISEKQEYLKF